MTFNLCYPGSDIEFHEFIIRTLLEFNEPPRLIMLVVDDDTEFTTVESVNFRNDRLYPLVKYSYITRELINKGEKDKLLSNILVLHRLNLYNFDVRRKTFSPLDTIMACGSMPISFQREGIDWTYITDVGYYDAGIEDPPKVNAFRKIINMCYENDVQLMVVFPPRYKSHNKSFEKRIRSLSGSGVNLFIYDTLNLLYRDKNYYSDDSHLKRNGAEIFTNELIYYLGSIHKD